jgi:hypothetical protein
LKIKPLPLFAGVGFVVLAISASAQTLNSWANPTNDTFKWETGSDWSLGVPPSVGQSIMITNRIVTTGLNGNRQKTIKIDATTASSFPGTMTVNDLTVSAPGATQNTLLLSDTGSIALTVENSVTISSHGVLTINNSALQVGVSDIGNIYDDGTVLFNTGIISNTEAFIGNTNTGVWTMNDGTWTSLDVMVAFQSGSSGTLTIAGGTNVNSVLEIGKLPGATGTVWMTGGLLDGSLAYIGAGGVGQMTVSNGLITCYQLFVGRQGLGTLSFAGGTATVLSDVVIGGFQSTGAVWMTGGQLQVAHTSLDGQMTISNGTWQTGEFDMGSHPRGTLTVAGGVCGITSNLIIGSAINSTDTVWVTGGQLIATNGSTIVSSNGVGQLTVSNGTMQISSLNLGASSGSGTLTMAGGTTVITEGLQLGINSGAAGTAWLVGGQLYTTNNTTYVGDIGSGQMTESNGTWLAGTVQLGNGGTGLASGTLTIAGGTANAAVMLIGGGVGSAGTVWVTGGQLILTNFNFGSQIGSTGIGQLTISNGVLLASALQLGGIAGAQGTVTIAGGTVIIPAGGNGLDIAASTGSTGTVLLTGGQLYNTNNDTLVGYSGVAQMTVLGGTWFAAGVEVGPASQGTLTIAGGTNTFNFGLYVGGSDFGTGATSGTVWMTGGQLMSDAIIGNFGPGQMTFSNGFWQGSSIVLDDGEVNGVADASGTLTIAGGSITMSSGLTVSLDAGTTGTVWMTGGQLSCGFSTFIGEAGVGRMTVSNGTWQSGEVDIGFAGAQGTLTVAGGTNDIYNTLEIGTPDCRGTGTVIVASGNLFVTNADGNAVLDLENGTFTLISGTVVVNEFVMTNACAHFVRTGGTLIYNSAVLNPNLDADGDGIPNGYEQAHGLDPLNPADAQLDNDGDGFSNLEEYQAGTIPNNPNSTPFHITSIARAQQGNGIVITWMTTGGKTNVVQATSGTSGSYSNNFTDISPIIVPSGSGLTSRSYTDIGGATNMPARYYRIRLVP